MLALPNLWVTAVRDALDPRARRCGGEAMIAVIVPRIAQMLFVMFGISVVVFLIFFATPGADPSARIAGRNATPETLEAVEKDSGLDRPLPVRIPRS